MSYVCIHALLNTFCIPFVTDLNSRLYIHLLPDSSVCATIGNSAPVTWHGNETKCSFYFWQLYVLWLGVYWWKRDVKATHDMTSGRHTTWRQSVTRRDVRYVPRKTRFRYMAPSHECTSCLARIAIGELASCSMLLDTSRVPLYHCARSVTCNSRYDKWTLTL